MSARRPKPPTDRELLQEIAEGLEELRVQARVSGWLMSEQKADELQMKLTRLYVRMLPKQRGRAA